MAIILPSKNIFEKTNSKIIDNQISNIYVERKVINRVVEYDTTVARQKIDTQSFDATMYDDSFYRYFYASGNPYAICDTRVDLSIYRARISYIDIPKAKDNQMITSALKKDVKISKTIPIHKLESYSNYYKNALNGDKGSFEWRPNFVGAKIEETKGDFSNFIISENRSSRLADMLAPNNSQDEKNRYKASYDVAIADSKITAIVKCDLNRTQYNSLEDISIFSKNEISITPDTYEFKDIGDSYRIQNIDVFAGFQAKMSFAGVNYASGKNSNNLYPSSELAIRAVTSEIVFSLNGSIMKLQIDTENKIAITGDGNFTYSIGAGNELMQASLYSSDGSFFPIGALASRIKKAYENGKETAEIRCSVSDYYDDADIPTLAISKHGTKKFFAIGDEVIPMVKGKDGKDYPLSTDKEGNPKVFVVVGNKRRYSGVFWQILSLQER